MNERVKVFNTKMEKTLSSLEKELQTIRAGRANPHVLDKLQVEYYGMPTTTADSNSTFPSRYMSK